MREMRSLTASASRASTHKCKPGSTPLLTSCRPERGSSIMHKRLYESDAEVEEVVRRFESCGFAVQEFDHVAHLTVAVVYLTRFGECVAMDRMRESLLRFSRHHG